MIFERLLSEFEFIKFATTCKDEDKFEVPGAIGIMTQESCALVRYRAFQGIQIDQKCIPVCMIRQDQPRYVNDIYW